MRVVLTDSEWYYGKRILTVLTVIIGVCSGIGIYYYESRMKEVSINETENIQTKDISILSKQSIVSEEKSNQGKKGIPVDIRLDTSLKVEPEKVEDTSHQSKDKPRMIGVGIQGAVKKPGLYWVEEGTRLQELIEKAGGALENAELRYLNIASVLLDGTTVVIPEKQKVEFDGQRLIAKGTSQPIPSVIYSGGVNNAGNPVLNVANNSSNIIPPISGRTSTGTNPSGLIDLNHASQKELETLPGIGPVLAQAIIAYREEKPFESVDELLQVSGIGPKRFEKIKDLVTITPP